MDSFTANTVFVNLFCFSGLGTLPAGLFSGCTALTRLTNNFQQTLIISIPKAFIDGLPQSLTSFSQLFTQMNNLRAVGEGAFDSASRVTDMSNVFSSSPQLVSVPRDLFRNCKSVTSFYQSFIYCSALRNQYTFRDGGTAVLTSADLILTDGTTIDLTAVQTEPWSMNTGDQVFIRGNGITLDNIDISYTYTTGGIRTVKLSAAVDPSQYGILRVVDTTNGFILESTQNTAWWWATGVIAVQLNAVDGFELWERAGKPGYPSTIVGTQCYTGTNMVPELGGTIPSGWR
jgi:hypothetical protein